MSSCKSKLCAHARQPLQAARRRTHQSRRNPVGRSRGTRRGSRQRSQTHAALRHWSRTPKRGDSHCCATRSSRARWTRCRRCRCRRRRRRAQTRRWAQLPAAASARALRGAAAGGSRRAKRGWSWYTQRLSPGGSKAQRAGAGKERKLSEVAQQRLHLLTKPVNAALRPVIAAERAVLSSTGANTSLSGVAAAGARGQQCNPFSRGASQANEQPKTLHLQPLQAEAEQHAPLSRRVRVDSRSRVGRRRALPATPTRRPPDSGAWP